MKVYLLLVPPLRPCPEERQYKGLPVEDPGEAIDRHRLGACCRVHGRQDGFGDPPDYLVVTDGDPRFVRGAVDFRNGFFPTTPVADWEGLLPPEVDPTIELGFATDPEGPVSDPLTYLILSFAAKGYQRVVVCARNIFTWIGAHYKIFPTSGGPVLVTAEVEGGRVLKGEIRDLGGFKVEPESEQPVRQRFWTTTLPDFRAPKAFVALRLLPGDAA